MHCTSSKRMIRKRRKKWSALVTITNKNLVLSSATLSRVEKNSGKEKTDVDFTND